jgi:hypothetical protein
LIACFNIGSGDVEDAPAPNALNKFDVFEKNGGVYIKGEEAAIRAGQRDPVGKRSVTSQDRVVVIGGYVCCILYRSTGRLTIPVEAEPSASSRPSAS